MSKTSPEPIIPEAVLKHHTAVLGKTGSGKTSTAKLIVEQAVAAGARVCVLDPVKSDWWGLTSSADGRHPGLPFQILGGPHGHVPLHDGAGAAIGELVGTGELPLSIIDMADFKAGGPNRFFNAFADMLMRKMKGVLYLVIEEAHEFAPKERSGVGDENMAVYYSKKLATAGRSKGIRLVVCSQAVQQLHNRVLGSCETLIVHRFTAPADQEPVLKWLKSNVEDKAEQQEIARSLRGLKTGEGWICTGDALLERKQFPRIHTFDNSATPDSNDASADVVVAKIDVDKLRATVGSAVAEAEANDPAKLKAEISRLNAQVLRLNANSSKPVLDASAVQAAEDRGRALEQRAALRYAQDMAAMLRAAAHVGIDRAFDAAPTPDSEGPGNYPLRTYVAPAPSLVVPTLGKSAAPVKRPAPVGLTAAVNLPIGERAILAACIQYPHGLRRDQLTVIAGYKKSSRDAYIARLAAKGYVETGATVRATDAGRAALPDAEPLPRGRELQDLWRGKLPIGERKILDVVIEAYPNGIARDALDVGFQKSSRDAYLARLAAKELVTMPSRGEVRASEDLF